ncbi:MAG: barstar family protein [Trueperaceae bacterium]
MILEQLHNTRGGVLEVSGIADALVTELSKAGYTALLVDRAPVFDKETLVHALYQSCGLPAHFGFNWDALEAVLKASSIRSENANTKGELLMFRNFGVLEQRSPNVAATFLDIIDVAVKTRQEKEFVPLWLVKITG